MNINTKYKKFSTLIIFTACLFMAGEMNAQTNKQIGPGGVTDELKVWLKADDANSLTLIGTNVSVWKDQTDKHNDYSKDASTYAGTTYPQYIACDPRMNYHPAVNFGIKDYLAIAKGPMSVNIPQDFTSFLVYYATDFTSNVRLYTHGFGSANPRSTTTRHPSLGFAPGDRVGRVKNNGGGTINLDGTLPGFKPNTTALQMINTHIRGADGSGYAIHDFGGWQEKVTATGAFGQGFKMASGGTLGGASIDNGSFQGLISEVFFYERALTPIEQDKIRTYIGIKYGITLDADGKDPHNNYDYVLSDGTDIWEGNVAPAWDFHNNVAGLVRDDKSDLFINKAKSSADGATITMQIPGHNECGQGTKSMLPNDLSAIYWGNDNATEIITFSAEEGICGDVDRKLKRVWLVNKTNLDKQEVTIRIGSSSVFPFASNAYQVYLLVADSKEKLNNNQWDAAIPTSYIDGEHQANYIFKNKYTYFSLGVKPALGTCEACEFSGVKKLDFTHLNWTSGTQEKLFDLGDGFTANVKTTIATPATWFSANYPLASYDNSLSEYRKGNINSYMTTEIDLSSSTSANFQIFGIGRRDRRFDDVEIYGMCGTAKINPILSYVTTKSSYTITGNHAIANQNTASYTNLNGRLQVEFNTPVDKIFIQHKSTGIQGNGYKQIGIGKMEFACPIPLPPINEDGLIFVKQAPQEAFLCETIEYTYRIINTNCSTKEVNFTDILPKGLKWKAGSLSLGNEAMGNNTQINEYGQSQNLSLKGIIVPSGGTLTYRARATFDDDAISGEYSGRGKIDYQIVENNQQFDRELESCDRLTAGCATTTVTALATPSRPLAVELQKFSPSTSCYKEDGITTMSITINNPNTFEINNVALNIEFNEEFTPVPQSLTSNSVTGLNTAESFGNVILAQSLNIPSGVSTIKFQIQAPNKSGLINLTDASGKLILDQKGNPIIIPLTVSFGMNTSPDNTCMDNVFNDVNGKLDLRYCISKNKVVSNINTTSWAK